MPVALEIGKAVVVRGSETDADVCVLSLGAMLPEAIHLAELLEAEGLHVAVVNARFAKPVDRDCLARFGPIVKAFVTLEDHVLAGGFGSAVLETLNELELAVPVVRVGWPDAFIEHGKVEALREKYGLTAQAVMKRVRPYVAGVPEERFARV